MSLDRKNLPSLDDFAEVLLGSTSNYGLSKDDVALAQVAVNALTKLKIKNRDIELLILLNWIQTDDLSVTEAAKRSVIGRGTLYRRLQRIQDKMGKPNDHPSPDA